MPHNQKTILTRKRLQRLSAKCGSSLSVALLALLVLNYSLVTVYAGEDPVNRSSLQRGCPDLIDLIKKLSPSVVSITVERNEAPSSVSNPPPLIQNGLANVRDKEKIKDLLQTDSIGSGFFCDSAGHIVTNAHVVDSAEKIQVTMTTGKALPAKVVGVHPKVDLALIKIDPGFDVTGAKIGDSSGIEVGEWVLAVGNPFGLGRTVTVGIVSGKGRFLGLGPDDNFIQTDASINPGNSGGPLFNMVGEVIGVNTAIIASGKGIGFSIPSNYIQELLEQKPEHVDSASGWLGVYVDDIDEPMARSLGLSSPKGVLVDEVLGATPAFLAGIRKGDLILSADGKSILDRKHLSSIVAGKKPGNIIRMVVLREKKSRNVDVIMGKAPE
ncbi:MAG: trypsin-like peptidase domain-containing protein [Deltaproteobacteria bacterium]|nr:trypsin-like peptidase domain-containing protein [Deltaproteobacteria bacterium]